MHLHFIGLNERCSRSHERINDNVILVKVIGQEPLDKLWNELPKVRVHPVYVLSSLSLSQTIETQFGI